MAPPSPKITPTKRDVVNATTIVPEAIQEEFVRTPGDIAYWAEQYSQAYEAQLTAKADRERIWEQTILDIKKTVREATAAGVPGKITEKEIEAQATVSQAYQDAVRAEIKATVHKDRVGGILDAVKSKRDVLISLGAHMRHQGEMAVLREQRNRRT